MDPGPARAQRWWRWPARALVALAAAVAWTAALLGVHVLSGRSALAAAGVALAAGLVWRASGSVRVLAGAGLAGVGLVALWAWSRTPSDDRAWGLEQSVAPAVEIEGDLAVVRSVRCFDWLEPTGVRTAWEDRSYDLSRLTGVDVIVEPFGALSLAAHTMLSFAFEGGERLLLSIEARKEAGEDYGAFPGMLAQFELIYVFCDERDALTVRAVTRGDALHAYPARVTPTEARALFERVARGANAVRDRPRFYRLFRDNCTTAWVRHVDELRQRPFGVRPETALPGLTAQYMHDQGLMDTDLPFERARDHFRVDHLVREHAALRGAAFSRAIRPWDEPPAMETGG